MTSSAQLKLSPNKVQIMKKSVSAKRYSLRYKFLMRLARGSGPLIIIQSEGESSRALHPAHTDEFIDRSAEIIDYGLRSHIVNEPNGLTMKESASANPYALRYQFLIMLTRGSGRSIVLESEGENSKALHPDHFDDFVGELAGIIDEALRNHLVKRAKCSSE